MTKMFIFLLLSMLPLTVLAFPKECLKEIDSFCPQNSWENIVNQDYICLRRSVSKMGMGCHAWLLKNVKYPCFSDILVNCNGTDRDFINQDKCLAQISNKLSPTCKLRVESEQKLELLKEKNCPEVKSLCPNPKDNYFRFCLYKAIDAKKVSDTCQKILKLRYDL